MKHINRFTVLLVILLSGYSCIGEDMSDCPVAPSIMLEFCYTRNMANINYFPQEVDTLLVTLYNDTDDSYSVHYRVAQDELDKGYILPLNKLADGSYTVVAWGKNTTTDYKAQDYTTTKQNMHIDLQSATGQVSPDIGNLFHGMTQLSIQQGSGSGTVNLTKNTSQLTIRLADLTATTGRPMVISDYTIEITDTNGSYKYDNTLTPFQQQLAYTQQYMVQTFDTLQATCKMLRLYPDDDSRISIKDAQGNPIPILDEGNNPVTSPVSLTGQIMRNPLINIQDDLDLRDSFTLTYSIDRNTTTGKLAIFLISINDWTVSGGNPGI